MEQNYCKWDEGDIKGLHNISDVSILYTESNECGEVLREIGLDKFGKITHRYPSSAHSFGIRGIFDAQPINLASASGEITKDEFESIWRLR